MKLLKISKNNKKYYILYKYFVTILENNKIYYKIRMNVNVTACYMEQPRK